MGAFERGGKGGDRKGTWSCSGVGDMLCANGASCLHSTQPLKTFGSGPGEDGRFLVGNELTVFIQKINIIEGKLCLDIVLESSGIL